MPIKTLEQLQTDDLAKIQDNDLLNALKPFHDKEKALLQETETIIRKNRLLAEQQIALYQKLQSKLLSEFRTLLNPAITEGKIDVDTRDMLIFQREKFYTQKIIVLSQKETREPIQQALINILTSVLEKNKPSLTVGIIATQTSFVLSQAEKTLTHLENIQNPIVITSLLSPSLEKQETIFSDKESSTIELKNIQGIKGGIEITRLKKTEHSLVFTANLIDKKGKKRLPKNLEEILAAYSANIAAALSSGDIHALSLKIPSVYSDYAEKIYLRACTVFPPDLIFDYKPSAKLRSEGEVVFAMTQQAIKQGKDALTQKLKKEMMGPASLQDAPSPEQFSQLQREAKEKYFSESGMDAQKKYLASPFIETKDKYLLLDETSKDIETLKLLINDPAIDNTFLANWLNEKPTDIAKNKLSYMHKAKQVACFTHLKEELQNYLWLLFSPTEKEQALDEKKSLLKNYALSSEVRIEAAIALLSKIQQPQELLNILIENENGEFDINTAAKTATQLIVHTQQNFLDHLFSLIPSAHRADFFALLTPAAQTQALQFWHDPKLLDTIKTQPQFAEIKVQIKQLRNKIDEKTVQLRLEINARDLKVEEFKPAEKKDIKDKSNPLKKEIDRLKAKIALFEIERETEALEVIPPKKNNVSIKRTPYKKQKSPTHSSEIEMEPIESEHLLSDVKTVSSKKINPPLLKTEDGAYEMGEITSVELDDLPPIPFGKREESDDEETELAALEAKLKLELKLKLEEEAKKKVTEPEKKHDVLKKLRYDLAVLQHNLKNLENLEKKIDEEQSKTIASNNNAISQLEKEINDLNKEEFLLEKKRLLQFEITQATIVYPLLTINPKSTVYQKWLPQNPDLKKRIDDFLAAKEAHAKAMDKRSIQDSMIDSLTDDAIPLELRKSFFASLDESTQWLVIRENAENQNLIATLCCELNVSQLKSLLQHLWPNADRPPHEIETEIVASLFKALPSQTQRALIIEEIPERQKLLIGKLAPELIEKLILICHDDPRFQAKIFAISNSLSAFEKITDTAQQAKIMDAIVQSTEITEERKKALIQSISEKIYFDAPPTKNTCYKLGEILSKTTDSRILTWIATDVRLNDNIYFHRRKTLFKAIVNSNTQTGKTQLIHAFRALNSMQQLDLFKNYTAHHTLDQSYLNLLFPFATRNLQTTIIRELIAPKEGYDPIEQMTQYLTNSALPEERLLELFDLIKNNQALCLAIINKFSDNEALQITLFLKMNLEAQENFLENKDWLQQATLINSLGNHWDQDVLRDFFAKIADKDQINVFLKLGIEQQNCLISKRNEWVHVNKLKDAALISILKEVPNHRKCELFTLMTDADKEIIHNELNEKNEYLAIKTALYPPAFNENTLRR